MVYIFIGIILFAFLISQKLKTQTISQKSTCSICEGIFPEDEVLTDRTLIFCKEHYTIYKSKKHELYKSVVCKPGMEEESVALFEEKIKNYSEGKLGYLIPSYKENNGEIYTTLDYYLLVDNFNSENKQ